jgi:hypothetical protein
MVWDRNEGRYTTVLPDGIVAHAGKTERGWELIVPALGIRESIRNARLETWLTARPVVERVLEAKLSWRDPHATPDCPAPPAPSEPGQSC